MKRLLILSLLPLAACTDLPVAEGPPARIVGETVDARPVYQFRVTRSSALGVAPVSNAAIVARAREVCPGGYTEVARGGEVTRRISGVIYTDVYVSVVCT